MTHFPSLTAGINRDRTACGMRAVPTPLRWSNRWGTRLGSLLVGAFTFLWVAVAGPVQAEPSETLRRSIDQVLATAYAPDAQGAFAERVRPVLEEAFAFDLMVRRSVGPGWRQFTPDQQAEAKKGITDLFVRALAERFDLNERPTIQYGKVTNLDERRAEVATTVVYQGRRYAIVYRMEQHQGAWRIYDLVIEGVSLVANYRAQFDSLLKQGGPAAVLKALAPGSSKPTP